MAENNTRTPLITPDQFRELARPVSIHVDDEEIAQFIRECEDMYIIPAVAWANFKSATVTNTWDETFDSTFNPDVFLDGGEYDAGDGACGCNGGGVQYCNGLRKALAYYVYAKMLRNDGNIIARAGAMQHQDQYAYHTNDPELKRYNDTMDIAERYLGECMEYANIHRINKLSTRQSRCLVLAIGD